MVAGKLKTRGLVFTLDPSPAEERLLWSYCGASRKAHNWVIGQVKENLAARQAERVAGIPEESLTPALSWSAKSLSKRWNQVKATEAPWWQEVSMHAFRSGIYSATAALENWHESKTGRRRGRRMGFPDFKSKKRSTPSVSFVEINHQLSWVHPDRHHVRLMLPQSPSDPELRRRRGHLSWLHTVEPTTELYRLVESGEATIQKVTIAYRGGRWRASFQVRRVLPPPLRRARRLGPLIGVDVGLRHLATLSQPVAGLTDDEGHVPNAAVLQQELGRIRKLDRRLARAQRGSNSHRRLLRRRARLHGRIAQTRALHLHHLSTILAGAFDVVAIEDLNLPGMANRKRHLGRSFADAGLGELRRQLAYKTIDRGHQLMTIDRFYPSSKTCSACGAVKTKLPLWERVYDCESCGLSLDRDVNAARVIAHEASRLLRASDQQNTNDQQDGAGLRPETENAAPRPRKTGTAQVVRAGSPEGGTKQLPAEQVA
jgi:putative transposase